MTTHMLLGQINYSMDAPLAWMDIHVLRHNESCLQGYISVKLDFDDIAYAPVKISAELRLAVAANPHLYAVVDAGVVKMARALCGEKIGYTGPTMHYLGIA